MSQLVNEREKQLNELLDELEYQAGELELAVDLDKSAQAEYYIRETREQILKLFKELQVGKTV
jgi:hypothetical protein